jgi:hypothetical protein
MLISTALLLDSNIRNSVCTPAKLPCRRVEVGYDSNTSENKNMKISMVSFSNCKNFSNVTINVQWGARNFAHQFVCH